MLTFRAGRALSLYVIAGLTLAGLVLTPLMPAARAQTGPLRFGVRLSPELSNKPVSGRLLIFMTNVKSDVRSIDPGFGNINAAVTGDPIYTAAQEVTGWIPGRQISLDPDIIAFPAKFSAAPRGDWQVMALLDRDHSYGYAGAGPGDLVSDVVRLKDLDPATAGSVSLALTKALPVKSLPQREGVRPVNYQSPSLTRFWGKPVVMRAGVVLPPGYEGDAKTRYPTVYYVPGFSANHRGAWGVDIRHPVGGPGLRDAMGRGDIAKMIVVFLDPSSAMGHTVFADSVNNGPWGSALVRELIPYLEKQFRMAGPKGRFLTGHSSGGWSTLWLQVHYPDAFNGVWSTAPDPVDFRSFTGVNIAKDPPENFYRKPNQTTRNLVRVNGKDTVSMQDFVRFEEVVGEYGGQMQSFDAVFSPKGAGGRPMPLFDRQSGLVDPLVALRWRQYDISRILRENAKTLAPKLKGKLHVWAAAEDTFHLEEAVRLLGESLKGRGYDADVRVVPNTDHGNLRTPEVHYRILKAMGQRVPGD